MWSRLPEIKESISQVASQTGAAHRLGEAEGCKTVNHAGPSHRGRSTSPSPSWWALASLPASGFLSEYFLLPVPEG